MDPPPSHPKLSNSQTFTLLKNIFVDASSIFILMFVAPVQKLLPKVENKASILSENEHFSALIFAISEGKLLVVEAVFIFVEKFFFFV